MNRRIATAGLVVLFSAAVSADVTITQTMTLEGAAAAAAGNVQMPRVVTRIKGMKSRTDVEVMGQTFTAITDVTAGQVVVLQHATKTALILTPASVGTGGSPVASPDITITANPTGQSRTFDGMSCEEQSVMLSFSLGGLNSAHLPPEAAAMMKDARVAANGSMWFAPSAPGVADFMAFQKAATASKLMSALTALLPGPSGGMDKLWAAFQSLPGLPCLSEMSMTFEGSGPLVEIAKTQGPVKVIQRTATVSTDPVADDIFNVPADYRIEKK
jgi:hypothetical protein